MLNNKHVFQATVKTDNAYDVEYAFYTADGKAEMPNYPSFEEHVQEILPDLIKDGKTEEVKTVNLKEGEFVLKWKLLDNPTKRTFKNKVSFELEEDEERDVVIYFEAKKDKTKKESKRKKLEEQFKYSIKSLEEKIVEDILYNDKTTGQEDTDLIKCYWKVQY